MKSKKIFFLLPVLLLVVILVACGDESEPPVSDVSSENAFGYMGTLTVEVTVEDGQITEVNVVEHNDTGLYMMVVTAIINPLVVELQNIEGIDTITGAIGSSNGVLEAVRNALGLN